MKTYWRQALSIMFFLSGSTGLIFEVLWTRLISNLVGTTAVAMTCVFMVFIVALSVGAFLAGRVRSKGRDALMMYGGVEVAVGLAGLGLTWFMLEHQPLLINAIDATVGSQGVLSFILVTVALVGPPATLMGMTLPLALNALAGFANPRDLVTSIYGYNLLGGATGAFLTGFVLIWQLGILGTALFACTINVLIGVASAVAYSATRGREPDPEDLQDAADEGDAQDAEPAAQLSSSRATLILALAFFSGLTSLGYELLWGRLSKFVLGDRTMATSTLLAIYLACMALGSFGVKRFASYFGWRSPSALYGTSAMIFLLGSCMHMLGWFAAQTAITMNATSLLGPSALLRGLSMGALILLPATVLGVAFPLLMYGARELNDVPSATVGRLYFINSLGAASGSLLGGYFLPRLVGTANAFIIFSVVLAVLAMACVFKAGDMAAQTKRNAYALTAILAMMCLLSPKNLYVHWPDREELVDTNEDEYGVQVTTREDGFLKVKNNRIFIAYKLGRKITSFAQEIIAYSSCLVAPSCERVLNIGTGYGITAGAYTLLSGVEQLVTVEMLPYVFNHQRDYEPYNHHYLDDPRVERVLGDGRHYLVRNEQEWDIISVNVLDPYMPGSSDLFTVEFWELAKSRLAPGGVYCQLIFGADMDLILKGMTESFEHIYLFKGYANTYNVVAFVETPEEPVGLKMSRMTPQAREAFAKLGVDVGPDAYFERELVKARERAQEQIAKARERPGRIHSDNWPLLEYQWSQGADGLSMFDALQVIDYQ